MGGRVSLLEPWNLLLPCSWQSSSYLTCSTACQQVSTFWVEEFSVVWARGWEARNRELLEKNLASCKDVGKEKAVGCAGMILVPGTGDLAFGPKSWTEVMNIFSETPGKSFHSWRPQFLHLGNEKKCHKLFWNIFNC